MNTVLETAACNWCGVLVPRYFLANPKSLGRLVALGWRVLLAPGDIYFTCPECVVDLDAAEDSEDSIGFEERVKALEARKEKQANKTWRTIDRK